MKEEQSEGKDISLRAPSGLQNTAVPSLSMLMLSISHLLTSSLSSYTFISVVSSTPIPLLAPSARLTDWPCECVCVCVSERKIETRNTERVSVCLTFHQHPTQSHLIPSAGKSTHTHTHTHACLQISHQRGWREGSLQRRHNKHKD